MSDVSTRGSEGQGGQPGTAPGATKVTGQPNGGQPGAGQNGSGTQPADWTAGLQGAENRSVVEAKGWKGKSLDTVLDSYRDLESRFGKALELPAADAPKDAFDKFYEKLGRPKTPGDYKDVLKIPEGVPQDFPYDQTGALELAAWAHEAGLSKAQLKSVHDNFIRSTNTRLQARLQQEGKTIEAAHTELVKNWGEPESEQYKRNLELSNRSIRNLGGEKLLSELKRLGALGADGEVKSPIIVDALAKVGRGMFAEDGIFAGGVGEDNPFATKTENLTKQGEIIRANPEKAKALIRAAGKKVEEYQGLK